MIRSVQTLLFLFIQISFAYASNVLLLNDDRSEYNITRQLSYLLDTNSNVTIHNLIDHPDQFIFHESTKTPINLGVSTFKHWFKFDLVNGSSRKDWIMEIDYPNLDLVNVHFIDLENNTDTVFHTGKSITSNFGKPYTYSIVLAPPILPGKSYRVYIEVETNSFLILPIKISETTKFIEEDRKEFEVFYVLYGIVLALVAFNFILFILTREISYFLLTVYLAILSLNAHFLYGYGFDLFPHMDLFLKNRMRQILFGLGSLLFLLFNIKYLELKKYKQPYSIVKILIVLSILYTISLLFRELPQSFFTKTSPILYLSGAVINFYIGFYAYSKKEPMAIYFILSFSFITLASVIYALTLFQIIPFTPFNFNINLVGTIMFGMLLTIGLFQKITAAKQERARRIEQEILNKSLTIEIEERKKAEEELRISEEKFRLLFELSPLAISLTEIETGEIMDVNHQLELMFGFDRSELIGKTSLEIEVIGIADRTKIVESVKNDIQVNGLELTMLAKDKQQLSCLIYSNKVILNEKDILFSVFSDITEMKKRQQEIYLLSTALSQTANAIFITNIDGEIEYANPSMLQLTGYQQHELLGQKPSIFKGGLLEKDYYKHLWKTLLKGKKWEGDFYNRKKNGDYFWDTSTITPIFNKEGAIIKFIAIKEDITEKKKQQEILKESEKRLKELNATKDKFFSIIAHDLMNPFNAMMGFTSLLIESTQNKNFEASLNYATIIDQSSKRIYELLQNLLIWSRSQSRKITFLPEATNALELIMNASSVLRSLASSKNIDFEISVNENDQIYLDRNMIDTVLRNIITNAIKFSENNSKININVQNAGDHFLFTIADQGIGMDETTRKELFKLEKTTLHKDANGEIGTGLGMVICSEFILKHHGRIWVESQLGKGSQFYFTIPKVN